MVKCLNVVLVLVVLLCTVGIGSAADVYVAQTLGGTGDGSTYVNRMNVTSHNAGSFSPGDVIYLVDTITSQVVIPSNGTLGNRITYRGDYSGHAGVLTVDSSGGALRATYKHDITLDGIEARDGRVGITMLNNMTNITIKNCEIHDMKSGASSKGILISEAATPEATNSNILIGGAEGDGNEVYNCGIDTGGNDIVVASSDDVIISYNKCYGGDSDSGIEGIHVLGCENVIIEYNEVYDHVKGWSEALPDQGEDGIDVKWCNNTTVRYNNVYGNKGAGIATVDNYGDSSSNVWIYGNCVKDHKIGISIPHLDENVYIYNNVIVNTSGGHGISVSAVGTNFHVYGNTIINCYGDGTHYGIVISNGDKYFIKNNIIYSDTHNDLLYHGTVTNSTLDNNRYYYTGGDARIYYSGAHHLLSVIQSTYSQEANGSEGDPLFTSYATQDFTLSSTSPCIDNGTNLGSAYDDGLANTTNFTAFPPLIFLLDQDSYGTAWDIGAYVYGTSSSTATTSNVSGLWHFWTYENIPELHTAVNDEAVLGYSGGIYTFYEPFYQNKSTDTFYFNETVHLKSNVDANPAYFKWAGTNIIDDSNVTGWNTTAGAAATTADSTRAYMYGESTASGDVTDSKFSNLGFSTWNKYGIFLDSYSGATINNNTFDGNLDGLGMSASTGNTITNNTAYSNRYGLHFSTCNNNDISDNTIYSNTQHGIRLFTSSNNTLTDNNVSDTSGGYYDYSMESNAENNTITLSTKASEYFITDNTIDHLNFSSTVSHTQGYDTITTVTQDNAPTGTEDVNITVVGGTVDYISVYGGLTPSTWYALFYANNTEIESHVSDVSGIVNFTTDLTAGTYYVNQSAAVSDTTDPTYIDAAHSTTEGGASCTFSITCADDISLNTNGQYIFATNNTGAWVNESAVNFTATPQTAETIKTLTLSGPVGYQWYISDNAGNTNTTPIYTLHAAEPLVTTTVVVSALTAGTVLTTSTDMTGASWGTVISETEWDYEMGLDLFTGVGGLIVLAVILIIVGTIIIGMRGDLPMETLIGISLGMIVLVVVFPVIVMSGAQIEGLSDVQVDSSSNTLTLTDVPTAGQTFDINTETYTITSGSAGAYQVDIGANPNTTYVSSQIVDSINAYSFVVSAT